MSIVKSITTGGLLLGGAIMLWPRDLIGAASRRLEDARRGAQRYVSDGVQWAGDKVRTALSIETHALTEHALRSGDDLKITKAIVSLVDTARIWIAGLLHVAKRHTEIKWPPLVTLGLLLAPLVVVLGTHSWLHREETLTRQYWQSRSSHSSTLYSSLRACSLWRESVL